MSHSIILALILVFSWFKNFLPKSSTKESGGTLLAITFLILLFRYLGLLQFPELAAYDLLFFLRPPEPRDERIVIVVWDEEQIQMTGEETMSDRTLSSLIKKIREQKPRYIGLDLYRDVRVTSPLLSDEQNQKAYNELQEVFSSTPNLVGIEKVIPPIAKTSKLLEKQEKTTAADLISDSDNGRIRRGYLYPLENKQGDPAGIPSLGIDLGYRYLAEEGFEAEKIENNALCIFNPHTGAEITLEPLKPLDGSYLRDEEGLEILINWRKGNSPFTIVSASKVVEGIVPPSIFTNKIVLIGNTAISSADRHKLPLNRWVKPQPQWTYGVEIHAQIASSIISAALDGRPLIKTIPEWIEIGLIIFTVGLIALIAQKYRPINPLKLFWLTTSVALVVIFGLGGLAYVAFTEGYWITIVPSFLGSITTPIVICLTIYISKIKQSNQDFKQLIQDLNHSLQNSLRSIQENAEMAHSISQALSQTENLTQTIAQLEEQLGESPFSLLEEYLDDLQIQVSELNKQRENSQQYFSLAYLGKELFQRESTPFNDFVHTTVQRKIIVKQSRYKLTVELQEDYNSDIEEINIDRDSITSVIDNLLDNACHAIRTKMDENPNHLGLISIQTRKKPKRIELSIQDNGIGIANSIISQIFRPFKTFKAKNQGQGLGLSIVQATINRHQGNIRVETEKGQGSKFIVTLPTK
ncbi:MAG: CHASE2 domain-containing protein [Xenococcaceae cyanobacterium MO_188.B29]|nr:CHASE2 domain-containing protein [Xenococcaceae cyanobacterium MO_188.B29]